MPKTYEPIATYTVPSAQASYTFTAIPATYTDLVAVVTGTTSVDSRLYVQFNGDTASNYSWTILYGTGSSAASGRSTTDPGAGFMSSGGIGTNIINIMNYANTTTFKTRLSRSSFANVTVEAYVSLWRSTAAVNSITFSLESTKTLSTGTTLTLYGIRAA